MQFAMIREILSAADELSSNEAHWTEEDLSLYLGDFLEANLKELEYRQRREEWISSRRWPD